MADQVVREHIHEDTGGGNSMAFVILIIFVVVLFLVFYYGLPTMKGTQNTVPQISVPDKIDVNVNDGNQ